jgi:hypothetical protein
MIMFSKQMKAGLLVLCGVLPSVGSIADADNINTSGAVCQNFNASEALDIDYLSNGVRNVNANDRKVICALPRSPDTLGPFGQIIIDGHNTPGTCTHCVVTAYDGLGTSTMSKSLMQCVGLFDPDHADWRLPVTFTPGQLPASAYVSVVCTLPGNGQGLIHGVTAIQL